MCYGQNTVTVQVNAGVLFVVFLRLVYTACIVGCTLRTWHV